MANAYSILHNYDNQSLYSPDFQFIQVALNAPQTKLDKNRAQLNSLYSQLDMLKVHRDVDQEYIKQRIEAIHKMTDKYAMMDLSDETFAANLYGNISQLLDDKVKKAIVSTKLIEAEDAQWSKAKEKNDGSYSELNRAWALENSDRLAYENNQDAGAVYNGGAGFVRYVDVNKKIMDNIPKLQEALKAKWIETGPQQGYFQSQDTYEAVDPAKFNQAVDMLLNEEDRRQLRINAWGTYDKLPDEALKQEWDNYMQPKFEEVDRNIKLLEDLKKDPTKKDLWDEADASLENWRGQRQELEQNNFEAVANTYGRQGVYTTIYQNKFKDDLTQTYAYEKRLIDRELDEVGAKNVEFQQKLREFDEDTRRFELNYQLKLSEEERAREKWDLEKETKYGTGGAGSQFSPVEYATMEYDETQSNVQEFIKDQNKAISSAKNTLKGIVGRDLTNSEFQEVTKQLSPGNVDPNEKATITVGGKEYIVDMSKHYDKFVDVYNYVHNDSPQKKEYYKDIKSVVWQTASDLSTLAHRGGGAVYGHLPNYQVKVVKNKKGEYEVVQRDKPGSNYYAYLVQKKGRHDADPNAPSLTSAEVKTLEMYTSMSLIMDDEQDEKHSKGVYSYLRDETLKGVKTNGLFLTYDQIRSKGDKGGQARKVVGDASKYDDLSDMGYIDSRYTSKTGTSTGMGDFENRLQKRFEIIDAKMESRLQGTYAMPQITVQSTKPGTKAHTVLSEMLGLPADNKNVILIQRKQTEDGKFDQNTATVSYKYATTKDGVQTVKESEAKDVDLSILAKRGVPVFDKGERTPYVASLGESAATIPMGNNMIDNTKKQLLRSKTGGYLPTDNLNSEFYKSLAPEQAQKVQSMVGAYRNGKYIFEVKALEGNYYHTISRRNQKGKLEVVHVDQTPIGSKIYKEEVKNITADSYLKNEELFLDYVTSQLENF